MYQLVDEDGEISIRLRHPNIRIVAKGHDTGVYLLILEGLRQAVTEPIVLFDTICLAVDNV